MNLFSQLFEQQKPSHKTLIGGVTNAVFSQHTPINEKICTNILDIFEELELKYYLFAGTMVGYIRNNLPPPWMDDLDVIIFDDQIGHFENQVIPRLIKAGFIVREPKNYPGAGYHILAMQTSNSRASPINYSKDIQINVPWAQVDVFFTVIDKNGFIRNRSNWGLYHVKDIASDWVGDGRRIKIMNGSYNVFKEYEKDIRKEYGDIKNNTVIATHGKVFLKINQMPWAEIEDQFNQLYATLPDPLPPSVKGIGIIDLEQGKEVHDENLDSFDNICRAITTQKAGKLKITNPVNIFWAADLKRIFPDLSISVHISEAKHASRATMLSAHIDEIEGGNARISETIAIQKLSLNTSKVNHRPQHTKAEQ